MKAIKVNADYEATLFSNNKTSPKINEALEFLAFYLDHRPVLTQKNYSEEYLNHVQSLTGRRPLTVKTGEYENWWGELKDLELERRLNSKKMSAELNIKEGWGRQMQLVSKLTELKALGPSKMYLAKDLFGMSGQNIHRFQGNDQEALAKLLTGKEILIEPLLNRKWDFSHYVFPDGNTICYQNIVDERFQYKGSVFHDIDEATIENLSFYSQISSEKWEAFKDALAIIIKTYQHSELSSGFSIDSFIYEEDGEFHIQYLSEVNYRKTMGLMAYELGRKLLPNRKHVSMELRKNTIIGFAKMKVQTEKERVILLSPSDTRFDIVLK